MAIYPDIIVLALSCDHYYMLCDIMLWDVSCDSLVMYLFITPLFTTYKRKEKKVKNKIKIKRKNERKVEINIKVKSAL